MNKLKELEIGGVSFGLTSGIITTLGLIIGVDSATDSKLAIVSTVLVIAVADSLSDALGMHLSEESRKDETKKPIWTISIFTFLSKMVFSLIFLVPLILLNLDLAVIVSIVAGLIIIISLSSYVAFRSKRSILKDVMVNTSLTIIVIVVSYLLGHLADKFIK